MFAGPPRDVEGPAPIPAPCLNPARSAARNLLCTPEITMTRRPFWRRSLFVLALFSLPFLVLAKGCSTTQPNRDPVGEVFPRVAGQSLEEEAQELPAAFSGQPVVLLVGYLQESQFDIDRWVMGLIQAGVGARLVEIPTLPGLVASFASDWIDDGMRSGIPREDWGAVVTVYGEQAQPIAELTGTENGRLARVIVLDAEGRIAWFDDEGYSVAKALQVAELLTRLGGS